MNERNKQNLTLSQNNAFLGVSAGIAEYYDIKPIYIRAIFIIAGLFLNIITLIIYVIFYAIMPKPIVQTPNVLVENANGNDTIFELDQNQTENSLRSNGKRKTGYLLLVIGIICVIVSAGPVLMMPAEAGKNTLAGLWFMFTIIPAISVLIIALVLALVQYFKR